MEDIRDSKKRSIEDGINESKIDYWTRINAVLIKIYIRIGFIFKSYKWFWIVIIFYLFLSFPSEIGRFIGYWIKTFINSFNSIEKP
jgi:hypothetical protein